MPLVGTWKLISGKAVINDSTMTYGSPNDEAMKIVTPTHFSVVSKNASDGVMQHAVAGRVKMDATHYTEFLDFASSKDMVSKTATFTYKVEGNKWYIKGGFDKIQFDEVWQRVE
jgi:hypothetical protein